jgi:putative flippase GtrA
MIESQETRYLIGGAWNTGFGYGVSLLLYRLLAEQLSAAEISLIASVIAISMAFITYKLFVFRTRGNWLREYMRSYLVYGVSAIIGILSMAVLVDHMRMEFWLAQAVVMVGIVVFSYFANRFYAFGPPRK